MDERIENHAETETKKAAENESRKAAEKEKRRIKKLLKDAQVSENKIKILEPVIENTAWMKAKLDDARERIKGSSIAIPYNNGGGQKGLRENPLFKGYENLWRCYIAGMGKIMDSLPEEFQEQEEKKEEKAAPATVLDFVRNKRGTG